LTVLTWLGAMSWHIATADAVFLPGNKVDIKKGPSCINLDLNVM